MTYIIAALTHDEEKRLERAGFDVEDPPPELLNSENVETNLKMIWVETSAIELLKKQVEYAERYFADGRVDDDEARPYI